MKKSSLISAFAIIVIANALALVHAVRNRAGSPEAEITLTQRELQYLNRSASDDDSGVTLNLEWTDPNGFPWLTRVENQSRWLDRLKLQTLGFDCSLNPSSPDAARFYQRQRPRQAFVAMEYNGAVWRAWIDAYERGVTNRRATTQSNDSTGNGLHLSHLVAIDADLNPVRLRARHPDRAAVVVLPAVIAVTLEPLLYAGMNLDPKPSVQVRGHIQQVPSSIHVPRPFSDEFRSLGRPHGGAFDGNLSYVVRVRYGTAFEPWVTGVELTNRH